MPRPQNPVECWQCGWRGRREWQTVCHGAGKVRGTKIRGKGAALEHAARTEVVWCTPGRQDDLPLFGMAQED